MNDCTKEIQRVDRIMMDYNRNMIGFSVWAIINVVCFIALRWWIPAILLIVGFVIYSPSNYAGMYSVVQDPSLSKAGYGVRQAHYGGLSHIISRGKEDYRATVNYRNELIRRQSILSDESSVASSEKGMIDSL